MQGIVAVYSSERGARRAMSSFVRTASTRRWAGQLTALRMPYGRALRNDTPHPVRISTAAAAGGTVGAAVGLAIGPVGWLAVAGSGAGAALSRLRGTRRVDAPLRDVGARLTPGSSALVAVVLREHAREVERWLAQGGADLITDLVAAATVAELTARAGHHVQSDKVTTVQGG